ncbi:MAG TPA: GNAT family N-acetyltransferase [Longimicrobium sp.]
MAQQPGAVEVVDNEAEGRFEAQTPAGVAELTYDRREGKLYLLHTGVPEAAEGQGIAGRLVHTALEQARERGEKVVPFCSFARAYAARHPEFADVVQHAE